MKTPATDPIARGLAFIRSVQRSDGSFASSSSSQQQPFTPEHVYQTTFTPALVLHALAKLEQAADICGPLSTWLLKQRSEAWSFNYWSTDAPERQAKPYPDDLDDTFCALAGLMRYDPQLVDAGALGQAVRLLLATETQVGGPYRTWLVSDNAPPVWQDVDLAVNSNVAYVLKMVAQPLPNLTNLMEQAIVAQTFSSPYYPSEYPILYYIARAYRGSQEAHLQAHIVQKQRDGHWQTPLQTALMLLALSEFGTVAEPAGAIAFLHRAQQLNGSWPAEAFCLDPAQQGTQYFSGTEALTTALVVEALNRVSTTVVAAPQHQTADLQADSLYENTVSQAHTRLAALDHSLRLPALQTLERMTHGDHNREIVLLPYFFARSLHRPIFTEGILAHLGEANLFGWAAYTIYDDFLDGSGDPQLLSVANLSLRLSLEAFRRAVPNSAEFQQFVQEAFTDIDSANAWELANCRLAIRGPLVDIGQLPRYGALGRLAERSLGHALTPLGVLAAQGMSPHSAQARLLLRALKHYLIARQIRDDVLDWEEDFRAGQCSYVVATILCELQLRPSTYQAAELLPLMRDEFWHHGAEQITHTALRHVALAQDYLEKSGLLTTKNAITQLLETMQASLTKDLTKQADAEAFLASYRQTNK